MNCETRTFPENILQFYMQLDEHSRHDILNNKDRIRVKRMQNIFTFNCVD